MAVSRSSSSKKDQEKDVGCAKTVLRVLYAICIAPIVWFATRTVVGKSILGDAFGATLNLCVALGLFFGVGLPAFNEFGYADNSPPNADGKYISGPNGNGAFVITCVLFIVASTIWLTKMVYNFRANTILFRAESAAADEAKSDDAQRKRDVQRRKAMRERAAADARAADAARASSAASA